VNLQQYFEPDGQRLALDAFSKFAQSAGRSGWPVDERLDMYEAFAFRNSESTNAFQLFKTQVYDMLSSYWQVWRPLSPSQCWPPEQIFETINREFARFGWDGSVTLANFGNLGSRQLLLSCLYKLSAMKITKQGYPIMPVTKFLHFYNPALFPIYDEKVIWGMVLEKRFNRDFSIFLAAQQFEDEKGYKPSWIANYVAYGSWLLSTGHPKFMEVFTEWLEAQPGCSRVKGKPFGTRLYATAFEYTIIGAAEAEKNRTGYRCGNSGPFQPADHFPIRSPVRRKST
jgi:hypothetical protein